MSGGNQRYECAVAAENMRKGTVISTAWGICGKRNNVLISLWLYRLFRNVPRACVTFKSNINYSKHNMWTALSLIATDCDGGGTFNLIFFNILSRRHWKFPISQRTRSSLLQKSQIQSKIWLKAGCVRVFPSRETTDHTVIRHSVGHLQESMNH